MIVVALYSYHRAWKEGATVPELARSAMAAGADAVEVLDVQLGLRGLPLPIARARAAEERASLAEAGVPVHGFAATPVFGGPSSLEDSIARLQLGFQEATAYGARTMRVFSADAAEGVSRNRAFADAVSGLRRVTSKAGPRIALENHGALFNGPDDLERFLESVPDLSLTLDIGNLHSAGHDPVAAFRRLAPHVANLHLKDLSEGAGVGLGDGDVDVAGVLEAVREVGYSGSITIELEMPENADRAVRASVEFVCSALEIGRREP